MRWLVLLLYFLLIGCVSSALSGAKCVYNHKHLQDEFSDYYINIKSWNTLKAKLDNQSLQGLTVTSSHNIVLLTGQLPNQELREEVENVIQSVPHVAKIYNATTVGPVLSTKKKMFDTWITTKLKSKLIASNDIYADRIKVVTEDNIIYLLGIVTKEEASAAVQLAKDTEGSSKVITIFYYMTIQEIA